MASVTDEGDSSGGDWPPKSVSTMGDYRMRLEAGIMVPDWRVRVNDEQTAVGTAGYAPWLIMGLPRA